ncbi:MAG: N-formylglutamate deformylase [Puniceicoccaceae bacterium 5H]|nr:MAG: N-formylglutamate deformylase [Puniceicoccaceae bacterium 5H]
MILHIPHASNYIPSRLRNQYVLRDAELSLELRRQTDAHTDELFALAGAVPVACLWSALVVDVERAPHDTDDAAAGVGMGRIHTHTTDGWLLRRELFAHEVAELDHAYHRHHASLFHAVQAELEKDGRALLVDCHSFPAEPLSSDPWQESPRPDICLGTDDFHTPPELVEYAVDLLEGLGYAVAINRPQASAPIPQAHYGLECRVSSLRIAVNRRLYMDEVTGLKTADFPRVQAHLVELLQLLNFHHRQLVES